MTFSHCTICRLLLQQVLHAAPEDLGQALQRLSAGFVDILIALFVHLDAAQTDAGPPCQLIHRDSVVYKRFGIVKVRIVSPITDDQVICAYIYTEMLDQVLLRTSGDRRFD